MSFEKKSFVPAKVHEKMSPGEMLKTLRELQELSQSELGDLAGISQSNISAMEAGKRKIGREVSIVLAKALGVHPAVILFPAFDINEVA
jgi:transcriptional regulator with XRE-family HTH domain